MSQVTYQLTENVLFQKVAEETVILEPETGEYYTLNAVGTFMVEQLQQGSTKANVINAVMTKYEADKTEVEQDITALITQMLKQGLITAVDNHNG